MQKIEMAKWPRKEIYEFFLGLSDPFYMVSFKQDVSGLYDLCKRKGLSFYSALIWVCDEAINSIEAFRYAMVDGQLVLYDKRDPSFTILKKDQENFQIVTMDHDEDLESFCFKAKEKSEKQDFFIDMSRETEDLIYYSCLPWLDLTSLTNEKDLSNEKSRCDSIPRIAWGKYINDGDKKILTISMEVNHRFIDGYHIGLFSKRCAEIIDRLNALEL